jgi:tetratricopeptide (TPR) repeat protein
MASRVNVKFVVLLSTVLVVLAAGTGVLAYKVVFKSAAELAARGDAEMAEQDYKAAEFFYSKAVNKEQFNDEYLLKWREALQNITPETDRELLNAFNNTFIGIARQLALSDNRANVHFQIEQAELLWTLTQLSGGGRRAYENIVSTVNDYIRGHERARPDDPSWLDLRRYRGLARARILLSGLSLPEAEVEETERDLRDVLEARPTDFDVLASLVALKRDAARNAAGLGRNAEAERLEEESRSILATFRESAGPESAEGILADMLEAEIRFRQRARELAARLGPAATPALREMTSEFQGLTAEFGRRIASLDAERVDREIVQRLYAFETMTDPERRFEATLPVLRRARDVHEDNPLLSLTLAEVLSARREFEAAFEELQTVLERPRLPLGLDAVILINAKTQAVMSQIQAAVRAHALTDNPEEKSAWLARARDARERLSRLVPEDSPTIQMLDARIAVAEGDFRRAQLLVDSYNRATNNSDREALWMSANIAQELQQTGNARAALERLVELEPGNSQALGALAELEYRLGRLESAKGLLLRAQTANPSDPDIRDRLAMIEARLNPDSAEDPVERAIFRAVRIAGGTESEIGDIAAGIASLTGALDELGPDPRMYAELARLQLLNDDAEGAAMTMAEGLEHFPESELLREREVAVRAAGSVEALIEIVESSDNPAYQKHLTIAMALSREGREEDARRRLEMAAEAAPNNPAVLEALFTRAFGDNDVAEARRIADRAREANADGIEGLTYRARLLLLEGRDEDALAALAQASQRAPNNTTLLRLLSRTQARLGRTQDAIASLERALRIRPDELASVVELCRLLARENRGSEALEVARRSETIGRTNSEFMELLLSLEGAFGDKRSARDRRISALRAKPNDVRNRLALIELYIDLGQWRESAELIESTRSFGGVRDRLVELQAQWHAAQNDPDAARHTFAKWIAETPPTERVDAYVSMAQFLLQRNQTSAALTALRQARRYQAPGDHRIDNLLGTTLIRFGRAAEAYEVLRTVLENDPDPDRNVMLQACEALISAGRLDEAERLLGRVPDGEQDLTVTLLRGRLLLRRDRGREARALLDDAVSRWPSDHRTWSMRAEAEARVPELLPDALADLTRAIELRPGLAELHRRRADLLARLGREQEAVEAWREAVRANPGNEDLRSGLLVTLIRRGMSTQALQVAEEWFEQRPRDIQLRSRIAELFLMGGMQQAATDIYLGAMAVEPQLQVVRRLADLLLNADPPRLAEAERVFTEAQSVVTTDPALLLARARVFARTARQEAARNDVLASFRIQTNRSADNMMFWFSTMRAVFSNTSETLAMLNQVAALPGATEWTRLFAARLALESEATASQGLAQLRSVVESTRDAEVRYAGLRALAGHQYRAGDTRGALATWRQTLELRPSDWQVENNVAYVLATELDDPEAALPHALRAVQNAPQEPSALDTLGVIYLRLGRAEEAVAPLRTAVGQVRGTADDARYMVRLAEALSAAGQPDEARLVLTEVESLLDRGRKLDEKYEAIRQETLAGLGDG